MKRMIDALILLMVWVWVAPLTHAQDTGKAFQTPYTQVAIVQVKLNSTVVGQWEAAQRDYVEMCKKAAWPTRRQIWQVAQGNTSEFHIVTPLAKLSDLDGPNTPGSEAETALWVARASSCVESRRPVILENQEDLSIPLKEGRTPALLELIVREIKSGEAENFLKLRRDTMLPAYKKAGSNGIYVHRVRYGDARAKWIVARMRDSWADLGGGAPLPRALGTAGFSQLGQQLGSMTTGTTEWLVLRHRPDLSYAP